MKAPNQYRLTDHPILGSDNSYGNNGLFIIPHHRITGYFYTVQASDGRGFEHVSVTLTKRELVPISKSNKRLKKQITKAVERCCTWEEMCYIKSMFWDDEEAVMQLHPPKSTWVNNHPYCLHLWRPTEEKIPLPEEIMVGIKELNETA
jgi:hypothetical protein